MNKLSHSEQTIIDSRYIRSFAVKFFGLTCLGFSVFGGLLFWMLDHRLGAGYLNDILALSRLDERLPFIILMTAVIQSTVLSGVVCILLLIWGHAISGPMIRYRRVIRQMTAGDAGEDVLFREQDQLHGLAAAVNHLQQSNQSRSNRYAECLNRADRILEEYKSSGSDRRREMRGQLTHVYDEMRQLLPMEGRD